MGEMQQKSFESPSGEEASDGNLHGFDAAAADSAMLSPSDGPTKRTAELAMLTPEQNAAKKMQQASADEDLNAGRPLPGQIPSMPGHAFQETEVKELPHQDEKENEEEKHKKKIAALSVVFLLWRRFL